MLDYKLLQALAAVVDQGGFERAAAALHLTQPAVSQRVKMLEEQAGQVLLVRSHPPKPTSAGMRFLKHYRQVCRLEDDLGADFMAAGSGEYTTLSVGINADSLVTWFLPAVEDFLSCDRILLDLRAEDQDQTHTLLKDGDVLGCISSRDEPFQGCRMQYLGDMPYGLFISPESYERWFASGVNVETMSRAPMLIFNRKDELHVQLFEDAFGCQPDLKPFYAPSSSRFADFAAAGLACGMLPPQQYQPYVDQGRLVDVMNGRRVVVSLYWHCWNIDSPALKRFSDALVSGAKKQLG